MVGGDSLEGSGFGTSMAVQPHDAQLTKTVLIHS